MITRRFLMAVPSALAAPNLVRADSFPNGPFRILVPFGPGSATDQAARNVAEGLNKIFGVPAVVENKPGANGAIAADRAARFRRPLARVAEGAHRVLQNLFRSRSPFVERSDYALRAALSSSFNRVRSRAQDWRDQVQQRCRAR
jgi:tripartite-type tricarboxylate transporter receptor subunit TctC